MMFRRTTLLAFISTSLFLVSSSPSSGVAFARAIPKVNKRVSEGLVHDGKWIGAISGSDSVRSKQDNADKLPSAKSVFSSSTISVKLQVLVIRLRGATCTGTNYLMVILSRNMREASSTMAS